MEGGFVHHVMPPTDWHCGEIPASCYDKDRTKGEIRKLLEAEYLKGIDRLVVWLEERDGEKRPRHELIARSQLEILAGIDAGTIFSYNCGN